MYKIRHTPHLRGEEGTQPQGGHRQCVLSGWLASSGTRRAFRRAHSPSMPLALPFPSTRKPPSLGPTSARSSRKQRVWQSPSGFSALTDATHRMRARKRIQSSIQSGTVGSTFQRPVCWVPDLFVLHSSGSLCCSKADFTIWPTGFGKPWYKM